MGSDIFLSYCRADRQLAEQFVRAAAERGVTVWFDEQIQGGQDWRQKIVDALGAAKALVILFSDHSNASDQLIKELAVADSMRKLVIPVLVADCEPSGAYLYELASRNWISIHPNPETRLASLVDNLMTQLDLRRVATAGPVVASTVVTAHATPSPVAAVTPVAAHRAAERWFPLGRYDLFVLVPILVGAYLCGLFGSGENKSVGLGFSSITAFIYALVIAVRNARLNRSIGSRQSFASYVAVLVVGMSPVLVSQATLGEGVSAFVGVIFISLMMAVFANVFQVILRKIFQQNLFRSKVVRPLGT